MNNNKIKTFRIEKGWSQKQLGDHVGTSQQQIQRVESGRQSIRFDLAIEICKAFDTQLETVFPEAAKILTEARYNTNPWPNIPNDEKLERDLDGAGLEIDPTYWSFSYRLRGGATGVLPISSRTHKQLWYAVQRRHDEPYVTFEIEGAEIALNLNHLVYGQFQFDAAHVPEKEDAWRSLTVEFYLADSLEPVSFEVDPDFQYETMDDGIGQMRMVVNIADTMLDDDINEVFNFMDVDGETVFIRAWDVAMIRIPLEVLEPDLLDCDEEE